MVPEEILTLTSFEVLQGLVEYDPEKRLTPAAALKMPWFADAKDCAS
jgi:cell division cycle 2-like